MKKKIHLIFLLSLMVSPCMQAYDFKADGICYNYIPGTNDVEVTRKNEYNNDYFGDVVIPGTVVYSGVTYNVTRIGDRAFSTSTATSESQRSSYKLISVSLPDGITEIGEVAFEGCSYLISVNIPNGVKYIGSGAFCNCSKLTDVTIPNGLTIIESTVFFGCSELNEILIPDNIQTIERSAFEECGLTDISIPNSVTLIEEDAFAQCTQAVTLTLGENVKVIESGAFESCIKLTKVSIPAGVTSIGIRAFIACTNLKEFIVSEQNTQYSSVEGVLFNKDKSVLIAYPNAKSSFYTIPESVSVIAYGAFCRCENLTNITFSENITTIEASAFSGTMLSNLVIPGRVTTVGSYAFSSCSELKKITIPGSVIGFGESVFELDEALEEIHNLSPVPQLIGWYSFSFVDKTRCTLYVPEGSLNAYKAANVWKDFKNIIEESTVSVLHVNKETIAVFSRQGGISIDCNEHVHVVIFDVPGREIHRSEFSRYKEIPLEKGIYIVCINGKTRKITVQ